MATFKRVNEQETRQISCYLAAEATIKVGDVLDFNPATGLVSKCSNQADLVACEATGNQVYIVAQSDAVTHKTGTGYKEYKLSDAVTISTDSSAKSVVVGYLVKDITNVEF